MGAYQLSIVVEFDAEDDEAALFHEAATARRLRDWFPGAEVKVKAYYPPRPVPVPRAA